MKKIINCILSFTLCTVLSISVFFQTVDAMEIEPAVPVITDSSTMETALPESQKETSNRAGIDGVGSPNSRSSEPNGKGDEF